MTQHERAERSWRNVLYAYLLCLLYRAGAPCINGVSPSAHDATNDEWVHGSRAGQWLVGDPQIQVLWLTDGLITLPQDVMGTRCLLTDHTFAFRVTYTCSTDAERWHRHIDFVSTSGRINTHKLRQALKLVRRTPRPLVLDEIRSIATQIHIPIEQDVI